MRVAKPIWSAAADIPVIRAASSASSHVTLETLKSLASSHLTISVCLTGVIALQAEDPATPEEEVLLSALPPSTPVVGKPPVETLVIKSKRSPQAEPAIVEVVETRRVTRSVSRALETVPDVDAVTSPKGKKRRRRNPT
jgi:hypothetical protein